MACRNLCVMMSRVKANPLPPLVSKTPEKGRHRMFGAGMYSLAIVSAASAYAVLVVAKEVGPQFPICFTIGTVISFLSGLCLIDFLASHGQGGQSVYSCLYQSISEIIAYVVGWTWLLSLSAVVAVLCVEIGNLVDAMSNHQVSTSIRTYLSPSFPDVLPVVLLLSVTVLSVTGMSHVMWWVIPSVVLAFVVTAAISAGMPIIEDKAEWLPLENIYGHLQLQQVLTGAALCFSIFLGSQSMFRIPSMYYHRDVIGALGPLNLLCYFASLTCGILLIVTKFYTMAGKLQELPVRSYIFAVAPILPLSLLAVEYYHPLLIVMQDMSADGLLFRSLSKRWKSLCEKVPILWTFFLASMLTGIIATSLAPDNVLKVASVAPLFINCIAAITVLRQRYKDRDYWQYEPMLQNGAASHHHSRKRSTEFLPRNDLSEANTAFQVTDNSDSDESSETDIDSVVQEYKESVKLAGLSKLDRSSSSGVVREPTPNTSSKAKLLIVAYIANCAVVGVSCTLLARINMPYNTALMCLLGFTTLFSVVMLVLLRRLPQNQSSSSQLANKSQMKSCFVPWIPGLAFISSLLLLVHVIVDIWHVLLGWTTLGLLLYLVYGVKNSTAATSFYGMPITAQLSLQPFPFLKETSLRQVTLPERREKSKRKV